LIIFDDLCPVRFATHDSVFALVGPLEQLMAPAAGLAEVRAKLLGARGAGERLPDLAALGGVDEHARIRRRFGMEVLLPESERVGDGRIEGPGSWVVGLVLVQVDDAVLQIEIDEVEREGLVNAKPLPVEEPIEQPEDEIDARAAEQQAVLIGVQVRARLLRPDPRDEARRDRRRLDQLHRVAREVEHSSHDLGNVACDVV
jgi:hypothetical protein